MSYESFKESFKRLIQHYTQSDFSEELLDAKMFFFSNTGSLDENNPNYNLRLNQFYEWFFLDRPMKSYMKTPLAVCNQQRGLRLTEDDEKAVAILNQTKQHKIFEFIKGKKDTLLVRDLLTGNKLEIQNSSYVFGFDAREFFQARIVKLDNKYFFLNSFCFHPEAAQKFIISELKKIKENSDLSLDDFLYRLNKMRYKLDQYKHLKPEQIYTNDNRLGL